jgi:hypothetical protein
MAEDIYTYLVLEPERLCCIEIEYKQSECCKQKGEEAEE